MNKQSVALYYDLFVRNNGIVPKSDMLRALIHDPGNPESDLSIALDEYNKRKIK